MRKDCNPSPSEATTPSLDDEWVAKRRIAKEINRLTEVLVSSSPPTNEMDEIADQLEFLTEKLSKSPRIYGRMSWMNAPKNLSFSTVSRELNPISGLCNPIAPPVTCWITGDRAYGSCKCGWAYEGPPNVVHGGIIAAIFDHFLGMSQVLAGKTGMTGELTTRYHKPTPVNTDLSLTSWLIKTEGRKPLMRGELCADGVMSASCEGLFIEPKEGMGQVKLDVRTDTGTIE